MRSAPEAQIALPNGFFETASVPSDNMVSYLGIVVQTLWSWASGMHVSLFTLAHAYGSLRAAFWISAMFYWGLPTFGVLGSLTWAMYVELTSQQRTSRRPRRAEEAVAGRPFGQSS